MTTQTKTVNEKTPKWFPITLRIGVMLGGAYVLALYLFHYGGRKVYFDTDFDGVIQLLTIMGLYLGIFHCRKLFPLSNFLRLFLYGISILGIAVLVKVTFSALLYGLIAPELGGAYEKDLLENLDKIYSGMKSNIFSDKKMFQAVINPYTIAIMEGISLFLSGVIFSAFIALLLNMFRRTAKKTIK